MVVSGRRYRLGWNVRGPSSASSPDIVLLDANPLEDIRNTQTIRRVIKGGWVFDPEALRPPASTDGEN